MVDFYLIIYAPLVAYVLFVIGAIILMRRGYLWPSLLIGASSAAAIFTSLMAALGGPASINYVHGSEGKILGATGAFSVWQKVDLWVSPVALLAIGAGVLWLALGSSTLIKRGTKTIEK